MKTILLALSLAAAGVSTATAQVYQPNVVNGSLLGGIAGAIIGGHNHDRWGEGALIGAVAGGLLGAVTEPARPVIYQSLPVTAVQTVPTAPVVSQAPMVPQASVVGVAPVVAAPGAPQVVYVQQAPQVVYVPAYANAPAYYGYPGPVVNVGIGYGWTPRGTVYVRRGFRHW